MSKESFRIRIDRMDDDNPSEVQYIDLYTIEAKDYVKAETEAIRRFCVEHGVHKSKCRANQLLNDNQSAPQKVAVQRSLPVQCKLWP